MVKRWEQYKSSASFFLSLLLLLIVIYDYVGTYDETIIMDWYCMLGAINNVLSNGNHMNDNNSWHVGR